MGEKVAKAQPRMELHAVVIRANGNVEDHGLVAASHPTLWQRLRARLDGGRLGRITTRQEL